MPRDACWAPTLLVFLGHSDSHRLKLAFNLPFEQIHGHRAGLVFLQVGRLGVPSTLPPVLVLVGFSSLFMLYFRLL